MKPADLVRALEDPNAPPIADHDEGTTALLTLVTHVWFADGVVTVDELAHLRRLVGELDVGRKVAELALAPLDLERLAELYPDPNDRDDILTLVEHAMWGDDRADDAEWDLVDELVEVLGVDRG